MLKTVTCLGHGKMSGWLEFGINGAVVRTGVEIWQQGLVVKDLEGHAKDPGWHLVGWGHYRVVSRRVI